MSLKFFIQFLILSTGVNCFIIFIYLSYYTGILATKFFANPAKQYDYIIVGAGTAGSVIAHRIVTETNYTFIVLEAGGWSNSLFEIPVLGPMLHGSIYDWNYETVPQESACLAMNNKKCKLTQGKIVGGSSKLNNMIHIRGNMSIYNDWFHSKFDDNYIQNHFDYIENEILHLNHMQYDSELASNVLRVANELGYEIFNTNFKTGFSQVLLSQCNGKRWTTSDILDLPEQIIANALVEKVIIQNNVAKGVIVDLAGERQEYLAYKGVILAAGTYNTPKILQLSGIGPESVLKPLNIPIIKDLPVGDNLQDHVATGFDLILFNKSLVVNPLNMLDPFNILDYFINGKGPLTTAGCEALAFLSTKFDENPDLQLMVLPVGISSDRGSYLKQSVGINDSVWDNYFKTVYDKHAVTILPIVLHPKSKGEVHITSTDAKAHPNINHRYLSNEEDVKTLVRGLKFIQKLLGTSAMKEMGAFMNPQHFPGCESYVIFSDSYWKCYVRHLTLTTYHPVGSCSMGLSSADSVVDTSFKVFGIEHLYVADASVLPTMPSANINAAVAMMASVFFDENIISLKEQKETLQCHKYDIISDYFKGTCVTADLD